MLRSVTFMSARSMLLLVAFGLSLSLLNAQPPATEKPKLAIKKLQVAPAQKADVAAPKVARGSEGNDKRFMDMHEGFNKRMKEGDADILFIGDSITEGWGGQGKDAWEKFYAKRKIVNLGISGDQTQHVLWRLQNGNLEGPSKPKVAMIMIGTNNMGHHKSEDIANGITEIVKTVRTKMPDTKILLLAVFPRGEDPKEKNAKMFREKIAKTNEIIQKLDDGKSIFYLDIGPKFLDKEGVLSKDIMPDALHPNKKGYEIWAESVEEKLATLAGEKK